MKMGILLIVVLGGCVSRAGPFVTHISKDGKGGIAVEKCMVTFNRYYNEIKTGDCTSHVIDILESDSNEQRH